MSPFSRLSASFPRKYDVTDVIQQNNEKKMKVENLSSLLIDLSEILQTVRT